ncbi:IclR family transcriptional regulator [uncultured Desulfosarcina sp.]|uniref:IclR family transcriptional regulator n=1 Tax=uncultured Desulfosarcina sp. TaxID=218289 RepID=UPI0029C86C79|nr:IclR family transcriptional regulator [uncultured Desulfosarcina sp.]
MKERYYQITSLEKGIKILEFLSEQGPLTVSEVGVLLSIHRSASHRFLATLRDLGYVEKNDDNRYQLTTRILRMGERVVRRFEIKKDARKYMQILSKVFNETVNLGCLDDGEVLHLDKIDSPEILRIDSTLWSKAPAYCTGLGKAILSHLTEPELNDYLSRTKLIPHGPKTILLKKKLREELQKTFTRGYAIDDEELALGLRCVGAPVFDHTGRVKYALSISCPIMRLPLEKIEKVQLKLTEVCRQLSANLGYHNIVERQSH